MRIRIVFAKTDAMRFTSHLDLHHTWERTFRRAGLPLAYSQGFNPHPRINIASALPLGFTGENEVVDIWLEENRTLVDIESALSKALPPGIKIQGVRQVEERAATLQTELMAIEYLITLHEHFDDLDTQVINLQNAPSLKRERRGKEYDLRPLILTMERLPDDEKGQQIILVRLQAREGATGRPEEVVSALGIPVEATRAHRTRLIFQESPS